MRQQNFGVNIFIMEFTTIKQVSPGIAITHLKPELLQDEMCIKMLPYSNKTFINA